MMPERLTEVVILAGGLATRMRPLTETIPKSMLDVNGEPFIAHQLRLLRRNQITHVVLCVGYLGEQIRDYVGDGSRFDLKVDYSFDGEKQLGTAGAIKKALPLLGDQFFVIYGDSYLDCDYQAAWKTYVKAGRLLLMTVYHNQGQWDTSNVEYGDGLIVAYSKRAKTERMEYIDYGLGIFPRAAFDDLPADTPYDLSVLYERYLAQDQLSAHVVTTRFYEIGSFSGLEETRTYLANKEQQ